MRIALNFSLEIDVYGLLLTTVCDKMTAVLEIGGKM
jgi:hypothetical protein